MPLPTAQEEWGHPYLSRKAKPHAPGTPPLLSPESAG